MKKIIFIGKSGCGKTTLTQTIQGQEIRYAKTQAVSYRGSIVDTPGEFIENRRFYSALLASAGNCDLIGLVQDSTAATTIFPPNFAAMFSKKVVGIVSKAGLENSDLTRAKEFLLRAGAKEIVITSCLEKNGADELIALLSMQEKK